MSSCRATNAKRWTGERVFANPPYSRETTGRAIWKAHQAVQLEGCPLAVLLIPARTEHSAWHDVSFRYGYAIRFLRGRLRYTDPRTRRAAEHGAPHGSAVVIFEPIPWRRVWPSDRWRTVQA